MSARRSASLAILVTALLTGGCVRLSLPEDTDLIKLLNAAILDADLTCEELRAGFGLPYLRVVDTPLGLGLEFENQWVLSEGGNIIHVWHLPSNLDRGTVVLSMGSAGEMACYLFVAELLVHNGWTVFMYEYQGFGLSQGRPSLGTLASDAEAVVDHARRVSQRERVTMMGISLGSIPSIAVGVARPDAVNGVIVDSPVVLGAEIERFSVLLYGGAGRFLPQLDRSLLSEEIIAELRAPLLIFLNEQDQLTPPATVELLYERAGGPKELARFAGIDHGLGPFVQTALYTFRLDTFLSSVWRQ